MEKTLEELEREDLEEKERLVAAGLMERRERDGKVYYYLKCMEKIRDTKVSLQIDDKEQGE